MSARSFECPTCGGTVARRPAKGLTWSLRPGHPLRVPDSVEVPTCDRCGEVYLSPADEKVLARAVRKQALAAQAVEVRAHVETLKLRHGVTLRQIEAALAVTPSYLSHLLAGRKLASETLLRFLSTLAQHPATFRHPVVAPQRSAESPLRLVPAAFDGPNPFEGAAVAVRAGAVRRPPEVWHAADESPPSDSGGTPLLARGV